MTVTPDSVDEGDEEREETVRVRIWKGEDENGEYTGEADEVIQLTPAEALLWQDNPEYHSPQLGIDIHPDDAPATLEVYNTDSTQLPAGTFEENRVDGGYWDGPIEYGLSYEAGHNDQAFGVKLSGRILFLVTTPKRPK